MLSSKLNIEKSRPTVCFERLLLYSHHDGSNISRILKDLGEQIFSDLVFLNIFKVLAGSNTECLRLPKILKVLEQLESQPKVVGTLGLSVSCAPYPP